MADLPSWLLESWIEYAIAIVVALTRLALRTYLYGVRKWQGDDYLTVVAIIWFTVDVSSFQVIQNYGSNLSVTDALVANMTNAEITRIRIGSQINFLSWFSWIGLLWSCKGCMLFLYSRITFNTSQQKAVKLTAAIVGLTYIASFLANVLKCSPGPVSKNWQVQPLPGSCPAGVSLLLVAGITNFLTDLLILIIPIPMIFKLNLPTRKKIVIAIMLCSGILIIIVSAMRLIFSITAVYGIGPQDLGFRLGWTTRENFTAVLIVNLPIIIGCIQHIRTPPAHQSSYAMDSTHKSKNGYHPFDHGSARRPSVTSESSIMDKNVQRVDRVKEESGKERSGRIESSKNSTAMAAMEIRTGTISPV